MNAQEIINELKTGKNVAILSDDAFEFMREVERHNISCEGISMIFSGGQCVIGNWGRDVDSEFNVGVYIDQD